VATSNLERDSGELTPVADFLGDVFYRLRSRGAYTRLEPDDGKLSRPVLRGGSGSNAVPLPDPHGWEAENAGKIGGRSGGRAEHPSRQNISCGKGGTDEDTALRSTIVQKNFTGFNWLCRIQLGRGAVA